MVPASMARTPSRASSPFLLGASAPMPPIWIPIELKFAKPHSAKVAMVNERGSSAAFCGPSMENATNSFSTRSEEHTSELQSRLHLVCRLLLEKKKTFHSTTH